MRSLRLVFLVAAGIVLLCAAENETSGARAQTHPSLNMTRLLRRMATW